MPPRAPTEAQLIVLSLIAVALRERGFPPTLQELAHRYGCGVKPIYDSIGALQRKGLLRCEIKTARGTRITEAGHTALREFFAQRGVQICTIPHRNHRVARRMEIL